MSAQPEALRLADRLTLADYYEFDAALHCPPAAAELRRLHAEVERLSWDSIHTCHSECQRPLCKLLTRERDALLEALKMMRDKYGEYACRACDRADAAIKAVEGENHAKNL